MTDTETVNRLAASDAELARGESVSAGNLPAHAPSPSPRVSDSELAPPYALRTTPTVRRALTETLPEAVAAAAYEFIAGPLLTRPYRVGKRLSAPGRQV